MAITKTDFINYSRCPRYAALEEIKKEKFDADVSYDRYKRQEESEQLKELINGMYETGEDGTEIDIVEKVNKQLEAMMPYYKRVEEEAGRISEITFGGKSTYAESTFNQECFDFNHNGFKYMCYVDVYNEVSKNINIIEVKATTNNTYLKMEAGHPKCEKYSIWAIKDNIMYLKDEIDGYDIESEMPIKSYDKLRSKLFDRYGLGKYVFDLAIQRFIIEGEYKESNNEEALKNIKYYLAVLNSKYIFDGTYKDGKAVYDKDESGNELIIYLDMTNITKEYLKSIKDTAILLEGYLKKLDSSPCPLGKYCGYKTITACKYFNPICGSMIPEKNSSLSYMTNGQGFLTDDKRRIKGLELINEGYINLMDIPESWINRRVHEIQRECYSFNKQYVNKEKLQSGLNAIKYPIYHLDFETFPCPVPRFRGEWPYIQSPFEFSLHIEKEPGVCDKFKDNYVFLAKTHNDEREDMIKMMLELIKPDGTLFAQNVAFEKGRIKELSDIFPEYKKELLDIRATGFDLLWLVNTSSKLYEDLGYSKEEAKICNFYDKYLSGSYSIKKTLPVFTDLSYADLDVKNGTEAIVEYANYPNMSKEEFKLKYQALITYCQQDTWAMVAILDELRKLVK